jgi:hypothetical protein
VTGSNKYGNTPPTLLLLPLITQLKKTRHKPTKRRRVSPKTFSNQNENTQLQLSLFQILTNNRSGERERVTFGSCPDSTICTYIHKYWVLL